MPCTLTGSLEGDRAYAAQEAIHRLREEKDALSQRLAKKKSSELKLTQMLCKTCQEIENLGGEIPRGVKGWWKTHKKQDQTSKWNRVS